MTAARAHLRRSLLSAGLSPTLPAFLFLFDIEDLPRPSSYGAPLKSTARHLLKAQEDEYLSRAFVERLQSLADDRPRRVYLPPADRNRLALHRHSFRVARHQKVSDFYRRARGVRLDLHSACSRHQELPLAALAERDARSGGDHSRDLRVVRLRGGQHMISPVSVEHDDRACGELLSRRHPLGHVLVSRVDGRARYALARVYSARHLQRVRRTLGAGADADVAARAVERENARAGPIVDAVECQVAVDVRVQRHVEA